MISHQWRLPRTVLLAVAFGAAASNAAAAGTNHLVLLITIDGLSARSLNAPDASLPTLRKLAAEGAVAEGLRVSNPTVTWPNHTTLVTGVHPDKHGVLFNGLLRRHDDGWGVALDGAQDQTNLLKVSTVFDVLHAAGLRTAGVNWPCTRRSTTLDDNFPDVPGAIAHTTPRLRAELRRAAILPDDNDSAFRARGTSAGDETWTATVNHLLRTRRPEFLMLHLLATDTAQHRHGPDSQIFSAAAATADTQLVEILRTIEAVGWRDRTTLFVTSDHGFTAINKIIRPNVVLRKAGLFRPAPNRRAQCVSEGGTAFVYFTRTTSRAEDRAKVLDLFKGHEGILEAVEAARFPSLNLPAPAVNPQMGDLLLVAKADYAFDDEWVDDDAVAELPGTAGSHGYPASNAEMNGVFVAWGRGIKPGVKLGLVDNRDVAPTIAALFGLKLPTADGRVLTEILRD